MPLTASYITKRTRVQAPPTPSKPQQPAEDPYDISRTKKKTQPRVAREMQQSQVLKPTGGIVYNSSPSQRCKNSYSCSLNNSVNQSMTEGPAEHPTSQFAECDHPSPSAPKQTVNLLSELEESSFLKPGVASPEPVRKVYVLEVEEGELVYAVEDKSGQLRKARGAELLRSCPFELVACLTEQAKRSLRK